jgi:hypothetical protein
MCVTASEELATSYLAALGSGDVETMLTLFAPGAMVYSPLYGPTPAETFYPRIFADTSSARLTLLGVTEGRTGLGTPLMMMWFHFDWQMATGAAAPFTVVDVVELTDDGRINALHIIYDTVNTRPTFESEIGSSYRASQVS